jgi:hypothetical protein
MLREDMYIKHEAAHICFNVFQIIVSYQSIFGSQKGLVDNQNPPGAVSTSSGAYRIFSSLANHSLRTAAAAAAAVVLISAALCHQVCGWVLPTP